MSVVIAGASSGIGRATALAFAERGASVTLASRRRGRLAELAQECAALLLGAVTLTYRRAKSSPRTTR